MLKIPKRLTLETFIIFKFNISKYKETSVAVPYIISGF
jgi:hypothetical protein